MDIGSVFIMLAMTILVIAFVARPLMGSRASLVGEAEQRLSALQAERDKLLSLIQEIELDHAAGKIPDGDYLPQRTALVEQAAGVLRAIDGVKVGEPGAAAMPSEALDARIEAAVASLRQAATTAAGQGNCTQCGSLLIEGDRFCSHCGAPVGVREAAR